MLNFLYTIIIFFLNRFIHLLQVIAYTFFVGNFHYATCEGLLSMLKPIKFVFKLLKYVLALEKAINSVVHTGVKHESLDVFKLTFRCLFSA